MLASVGTREAQATEQLARLTEAIHAFSDASTDPSMLIDIVAAEVVTTIADSCSVMLLSDDGTTLVPASVRANDPEIESSIRKRLADAPMRLDDHVLARVVLETGQPHIAAHVMLVPLRARAESLGILNLSRHRPTAAPFDEVDRDFAKKLADRVALAIANARSWGMARQAQAVAARALTAQRVAESRFGTLAESGVVGVITARLDGTVLAINDELLRIIGRSREEILDGTVPWSSLTPREFADVDLRAREQIRTTNVAGLREKEFMRPDGSRVPVLVGSALVPELGEATSFVVDLTSKRQAEERIALLEAGRAADAKFRALLEAAPDAMVITDEARTIVLVNAAAEALFGWERAELVGAPIEKLIAPSHRHIRSQGALRSFTLRGVTKDGREFPADVRRSPITTGEGTLRASSIRDVTVRMEEEAALVRAKEKAEAASRELEAFSYSVAHDLRSPLRGINGFAQVLLESNAESIDAEGARALERIMAASKRMSALIDALLSLARFSRAELRRVRVDVTELAHTVIGRLGARVGTELVVEEGLHAEGDPALVTAVLDNLLGNAFKFTEKNEKTRIEVGRVPGSAPTTFFVKDDGVGFDMTYAHKLFTPFQRLHAMEEFAGTGIGLATVQRILARHGGRAWAESEVGKGAQFFFTLASAKVEKE